MNHSIHTLAAPPPSSQGSPASSKQHPMHQQLHHTLQHSQQPLIGSNNQNQQQQHTMLQFHQTLHHPYSTLHHHPQQQQQHHHQQQQQQLPSQQLSQSTMHFNQSNNHQQNQQQQQQQQQYNMNSDYSSSTYHIYDQISDLIIIKQQRMERKRQLEHRRKVIMLSLFAILLVGAILFLLMQSIFAPPGSSQLLVSQQQQQQQQNLAARSNSLGDQTWASLPAGWPQQQQKSHISGSDQFDASSSSRFQTPSPGSILLPAADQPGGQTKVILTTDEQSSCSGHGTVIMLAGPEQTALCKCDQGYWGERCELSSATYQPPSNQLLARCLLTNCSGNGHCSPQGRCQCSPGYFGPQCEFRLAHHPSSHQQPPVLPQMAVSGGVMIAAPNNSPVPAPNSNNNNNNDQQSVRLCALQLNNCNGNGLCTAPGKCKCFAGFTGSTCQERDLCQDQHCSGEQGTCQPETGLCQCKFGFKGLQCEIRDDEVWQRLFNCSNHGKFDYTQRKCKCDQGFAGLDCSEERCELADGQQVLSCGPNGLFDCRQNKCVCQDGYSGDQCQVQQCSAQCLRNGQCVDGACLCRPGFYGKHCSLNGCPNQCSGRGQCVRLPATAQAAASEVVNSQPMQPDWRCQCQPGAMGDDCGLLVERQCDDGIDNDRDGLVDCADSECCGDKVCQNSTLCMKSPDPLDILMRKQPPPPTSSFFQRMQFLIEKFSSQIYSNPKDFNDSVMAAKYMDRASVIRGRVTYLKQGVTGVRVSVAGQINLGMTLTRDGGYFDIMVNGGGAVVIEFRREPFATKQKTLRVPWNEIVLIDPVELSLDSQQQTSVSPDLAQTTATATTVTELSDSPSCSAHNYRLMRPLIVAAPKSSRRSHSSVRAKSASASQPQGTSRAVILRDSGMVQQSILLPGSSSRDINQQDGNQSVSLIYISSRANEFMSTISIQLTPPADQQNQFKLPQELKLIHLKIVIEGSLFEQLFEPQTNLSYTYAWNRRNVYRQKSFGLSTASVSVGYEYFDCKHVIWTSKHIQLAGHDLSISDIGNQWNLNIHHRYNYRDSILQRGDGQNFNLKADKPRVVQPILGDGYQRQALCPYCDGATTPSEQRLLKPQALVSAPDGSIYVGDYNLIRRIEWAPSKQVGQQASGSRVVRTVLELPTSRVPSRYSLALNLADNKLYMSDFDHHQIYLVKEQGKPQPLETAGPTTTTTTTAALTGANDTSLDDSLLVPVVGSGVKCQLEDRANCGDGQLARLARLIEPKAIAFDLSNRMYIADGPNVRMVDTDGKIYTILGDYGATTRNTDKTYKFPCSGEAVPMHKFVPRAPLDLAISPIDDTLHVLDDNIVYKITQDKRVQIVAGRLSHCLPNSSDQVKPQGKLRASEVYLQSAQSITFNQIGDLFISEDDQRQMISRVLLVSPEEDTVSLYAGLPVEVSQLGKQTLQPTVDSISHLLSAEIQQQQDNKRSSNVLPALSQLTRASEYKFNTISAIAVDQQGNLIVADKLQLRLLSIEPDLPQINAAGEYELQSPDNSDELLVFNRYGHHIATRELSSGQTQRQTNKYTFSYNVNTSFGQLASVSYSTGNKISIYRDGPHHSVKMIETAFGGQCKLDITRTGQVHSISTIAPNTSKTNFSYHVDGGLLKQSRDQASGELFDFTYDEFGRAVAIQHSSPKLPSPVECRLSSGSVANQRSGFSSYLSQHCSELIVAD